MAWCKQVGRLAGCVMLLAIFSVATAQQPGKKGEVTTTATPITYQEVLKLLRSGQSEEEILNALKSSPIDVSFTLGEEQAQALRKMRVSDEFIDHLRNIKKQPSTFVGDVTDLILILDCSGSMLDKTKEGGTKMDDAKQVVIDLIHNFPSGRRLAFLVYGHDKKRECGAVDVIRPLSELDDTGRSQLEEYISKVKPIGHTPIAGALELATGEVTKAKGLSRVVLITDGMETCHGDPVQAAATLAEKSNVEVDVIGFVLKPAESRAVDKIATAGRGKYYDAQSRTELRQELSKVTRIALKPEEPKAATQPVDDGKIPPAVQALIEQLTDESPNVRHAAAQSLGKMGARAKGAKSALIARIGDDVWGGGDNPLHQDNAPGNSSKDAALTALRQLAPEAVEEALVAAMKSSNPKTKAWAANQLANPDGSAKSKRKSSKTSPSGPVQVDSATVANLIGQLSDENANVRTAALEALKKLAPEKVEEALVASSKSENAKVKQWASKQLASIDADAKSNGKSAATGRSGDGLSPAVQALIEQLNDESANVRHAAAESLAKLGAKGAVPALMKRIADDVWGDPNNPLHTDNAPGNTSKDAALKALKQLAPDKVEEALTSALKSSNSKVKSWAAARLAGDEK